MSDNEQIEYYAGIIKNVFNKNKKLCKDSYSTLFQIASRCLTWCDNKHKETIKIPTDVYIIMKAFNIVEHDPTNVFIKPVNEIKECTEKFLALFNIH